MHSGEISMKKGFLVRWVLFLPFVMVFGSEVTPGSQVVADPKADKVVTISVKELAENQAKYFKKTIRVEGKLENKGKNYFTDFTLVLKDNAGNFIFVRPWLPTALPSGPPGTSGKRPETLSLYLNKTVELTGIVDQGSLKKEGDIHQLTVKSARLK
jgi:hypothetical protein